MKPTTTPAQWGAWLLLLGVAGSHAPLIRTHLEEAPYVGWLFIALTVTCFALALAVVCTDHNVVWVLAGLTCLAALVAFLVSRTVGLPLMGDDVGNWTEPLALPAAVAESLMVALAYVRLRRPAMAGRLLIT